MIEGKISIRQLELSDHPRIVDYFLNSDKDFLSGMGVDTSKLPTREEWLEILSTNFMLSLDQKKFFYMIWLFDNQPIGHSNINKIVFAEEAYMHLHIWKKEVRKKGIGFELLKLTIPHYFDIFKLKNLYCEPLATNSAPNRTLEKLGFEFIKSYDTIPGWINTYQTVNRWCLTKEQFELTRPTDH